MEKKYSIGIIIPVFHNGDILKRRMFSSLLRSKVFEKMHIYLIDDGGDDKETTIVLSELERRYSNVSVYAFGDGGSGVAGRPRNKGIELATEEWLGFDDPDDELYGDPYALFLEKAQSSEYFNKFDFIRSKANYIVASDGTFSEPPDFASHSDEILDMSDLNNIALTQISVRARNYFAVMYGIIRRVFLLQFTPCYIEYLLHEDTLLEHLIWFGKKMSRSSEFDTVEEAREFQNSAESIIDYKNGGYRTRIRLIDVPDYRHPRVLIVPCYKCIYHVDTFGSATNQTNLIKLLKMWIPGVSYVFELNSGVSNIWYIAKSILDLANDKTEYDTALQMLRHLYDYCDKTIDDDAIQWKVAFNDAGIQLNKKYYIKNTELVRPKYEQVPPMVKNPPKFRLNGDKGTERKTKKNTSMIEHINKQLDIITKSSELIYNRNNKEGNKRALINLINDQTKIILSYMNDGNSKLIKSIVKDYIKKHPESFIPIAPFADKKGICFSANGVPFADVSSYTAAKRLEQINAAEREGIAWELFKQNLGDKIRRKKDFEFDRYYASRFYVNNYNVSDKFILDVDEFGEKAIRKAILHRAEIVFSRASPPHSHSAALKYKMYYPDSKWYAEFSDPLSRGIDGKKHLGDWGDLMERIEQDVYRNADVVVFSNRNQLEYMLSYNIRPEMNKWIRKKSIVMPRPVWDSRYTTILNPEYELDKRRINIGYFGTFYKDARDHNNILKLLYNENVVLHLFIPHYNWSGDIETVINESEAVQKHGLARIRINPAVSYLEMLNLSSRMDYLYLDDTIFSGDINPYMPSKYVDYQIAAKAGIAKIIARVTEGSLLSTFKEPYLIKTTDISYEFAKKL